MEVKIVSDNTAKVLAGMDDARSKILFLWGENGVAHATMLCPVDTGRLRGSIEHQEDDNSTQIGSNVEYAPYIELGTSKMSPQPYLVPAIENYLSEYKEIVAQELGSLI